MSVFKLHDGHDPSTRSRLILLVEDHPLNQKVAHLLLDRMGYNCHIAGDGRQAVEAFKKAQYDAVLMDCHMPEMDGFEATRQIRENEQTAGGHVPIIAVTALAMAGDRERCLAAGMDDYVTKPIDQELLREKLVYWMNPGTISALTDTHKVIPIFENAFGSGEKIDLPVDLKPFYDSYGEDASELLALFVNSSERIVNELEDAVSSKDQQAAGRLAHELKGASWAVGADELARLSVFLEQAAGQGNWRVFYRTFARLRHHFDDVKSFIERTVMNRSQPSLNA